MNATLERLTAHFVQLIGPAAAGASPASSPAAGPHGGAPIVSASPAPAADESRAGLKPALPQTAATTPAPAGTASAAAAPAPAPAATPATAPKTAAPPAPPPPPPCPLQVTDHALKGYHLDATVNPDQVIAAATILDRQGFAIDAVTGVDWLAQNQMEVVYDYFHPLSGLRAVVRTRLPRAEPVVPTISGVFPGANWHERETHDFFGIKFDGHPNLTPFILPEDATFHPLRKDYQP